MKSSAAPDNKDVFDIKEKIATGSFGSSIFKSYNAALGQVAIAKKYPAALTNDYESFMATLDKVRECRSPHIVHLHGYYKATKYFWVVMEFCHGFSLHNLMTQLNRPLKESQIRTVMCHTLRGLEALHARSIVHTRVKASNILLTTFGVCKLAEPSPQVNISDSGVNVDGVVGNAYWSAPEVLLEHGYRTASDIWSLGITVIELAERQPPYAETHPSRVMVTIPARPPPEFLNPDVWSKYLKTFLSSCLQKNAGDRLAATQLLQQKMIKKADYKGMQTIVQKFMKLYQQSSRFYTEAAPKPVKERKAEEIPLDEGNWTESGTLVWSPSQSHDTVNRPTRRTSSLNQPASAPMVNKSNLKQSKSSPGAPRRNNITQHTKPIQQPTPLQSDTTESRGSSSSTETESYFSESNTDTMKRGDFDSMKSKSVEPPDSPDYELEANLPNPGPVWPVPGLSKSSENSQLEPVNEFSAVPTKSNDDPPTEYSQKTVRVKDAHDYTPSYMDFYKDTPPPLVDDDVEDPTSQRSMVRRNSIDERGIRRDKMREELQRNLDKVDVEYSAELDQLRQYFISRFNALHEAMSNITGGMSSSDTVKLTVNFYGKLKKVELTLMLDYMSERHGDVLRDAKEHYDLEHRFLMSALRSTADRDEEVRYNLCISENNELQASAFSKINRRFQLETEDIKRAIERIDYADAIAVE